MVFATGIGDILDPMHEQQDEDVSISPKQLCFD